jgi:hypothetical protein
MIAMSDSSSADLRCTHIQNMGYASHYVVTAPSAQGLDFASLGLDQGCRREYVGGASHSDAGGVAVSGKRVAPPCSSNTLHRGYFEHISSRNPARRIGTPDDIAGAVLLAMPNTFLTRVTLKVDGGEPLT